MARRPSTQVPPHELPASLREAGLDHWIREPLDDAVDRRRIIMPPAAAVLGTPARGHQGALLAAARHPGTLFMMGDNRRDTPTRRRTSTTSGRTTARRSTSAGRPRRPGGTGGT